MECEIGAIRADHEAKVEQLEEELRLERETRTQTQNKSVEFQQKIEVHEKEKLSMTAQVQDLQERVRKLEMQLSSQILQPSTQDTTLFSDIIDVGKNTTGSTMEVAKFTESVDLPHQAYGSMNIVIET